MRTRLFYRTNCRRWGKIKWAVSKKERRKPISDGAKNSAGFGTLLFQLTVIFIYWCMLHFTFLPALFLARVTCWLLRWYFS
jgi:hypothetical protein